MSLQDDFKAFLHDIEPSRSTVDEIVSAHRALRSYLEGHEYYSQHCRGTYLSGSYAKHTSTRPVKDEDHRDVDVVGETDYTTSENSADVIIELRDVLYDSDKYKSAHLQTHSVGITLAKHDIDVVPLATEGEVRFIGDLDDASWKETNPRGHIEWSSQTNVSHGGRYVPVVKMMKWWRREHCPDKRRWPKGITLEKIIADCFPEDSSLYEELMIGVMENIFDSLSEELGDGGCPSSTPLFRRTTWLRAIRRKTSGASSRALESRFGFSRTRAPTTTPGRRCSGIAFLPEATARAAGLWRKPFSRSSRP